MKLTTFLALVFGFGVGWLTAQAWEREHLMAGTYDVEHGKCLACGSTLDGWPAEKSLGKPDNIEKSRAYRIPPLGRVR